MTSLFVIALICFSIYGIYYVFNKTVELPNHPTVKVVLELLSNSVGIVGVFCTFAILLTQIGWI